MAFRSYFRKIIILACFVTSVNVFGQGTAEAGKTLFTNYCAQCHAKNMKTALTGPALGGADVKWDSKANLYAWIRNSQGMIKQGHPRAVELWNQYKPTVMTAFPNLKDDEISSILLYIQCTYDGSCAPGGGKEVKNDCVSPEELVSKKSSNWIYYGLVLGLLGLAYFLYVLIGNMNRIAATKEGRPYKQKSTWDLLTSKKMISFLIFAGVILGGYTTVTRAVNLGRQQGYAPDQPIKFSHITHACENKIDCQYCHDGARRSKHGLIPAANTCMNCHKAIKVGSKYGTAELTKIFASVGFDPSTNKYVENYENLSQKDVEKIYTKWIKDQYVETNKNGSSVAESAASDQWKDIVASLTSDVDNKVQGPIEWTRIHNLPDHAYFNHAQHVNIGKVACQTCHGPVEKMEVMRQHSPLSMGWCINCHRESEVKFKDNEYYSKYASLHEELKSGKRDKVTVADIGGLECQKCHY